VVEIQSHLRTKENLCVSVNTIHRTLQQNSLLARVKKKKPLLTKQHHQSHLAFAKKYKDWMIEDWRHVVWSDESKFQLFGSDGRQWYWKKPNEPLSTRHIRPTVKHGSGNIMVWGCFTSGGIGYLCRIDGSLDGELYRKILNDEFIATLNWYNIDKEQVVFQHDNDLKHTANLTKQWFVDNNIKVLDWPSQSPDLNPIEHLWNEVDRHLRNLPSQITSKSDLWDKLQGVWEGINLETCTKLIDTMPEHIRDILKANGGYTRW
jgi:DDE superfamily endonuclease/Transposase